MYRAVRIPYLGVILVLDILYEIIFNMRYIYVYNELYKYKWMWWNKKKKRES